jgi:hypothetical protein
VFASRLRLPRVGVPRMTRPALVWEPCAGSAALSRALVGAQQGRQMTLPMTSSPALGAAARSAP